MKYLFETAGDFQLVGEGQRVPWNRPAVLESSHFTQIYMASGKLLLLAQLKDEATDDEFVEYLKSSEGDVELATASFIAAFKLDGDEESPASKKPRGAKAAE